NNNTAWAAAIYRKLLGRPVADPNSPEVAGLVSSLLGQPTYAGARQNVIGAILGSPEYTARLITQHFLTYLSKPGSQRFPTQAEIALFQSLSVPPAGQTRDDYWLSLILSSAEFFSLSGAGASNQQWAAKVDNRLQVPASVGAQSYLVFNPS